MSIQKPLEIIERKNNERWKSWLPAEKAIMKRYYEKIGGVGVKKFLPNKSIKQIYEYATGHNLHASKSKSQKKSPCKLWTVKELEELVRLYPNHTYKEIGEKLGRTEAAITKKVWTLGLKKKEQKPFTNIEKSIIREFYPYEGIDVSKRLPEHSVSSISHFVTKNNLTTLKLRSYQVNNIELTVMKKLHDEGCTTSYIAEVTGYSICTVYNKLKLVGKFEKLKENAGTTWSESDKQELTVMFEGGVSISDCADILSRTESAVTQKARKMGLM